jgi:dipeptidyl aminopeptidase/acylaminoacyl peptidase
MSVPFRDAAARSLVSSVLLFARLRYGLDFDHHTPLKAITQTHTPILLIHGTEDHETPATHSIALAAASRKTTLWLVSGAGHCGASAASPVEFRNRVLKWFADH